MKRQASEDERHLRELFREVYPSLCRYCVRLNGDPDAAEDVAQEAFVRLLDARLEGGSAVRKAWLFRTAGRLIKDRAKVKRNRLRLLRTLPQADASPVAPDGLLELKERRERLRAILDVLSERDRRILMLGAEGFAYREIGEILDVAPTSVGALLLRARRRLAEALLKQESDEAAIG